MNDDCLNRDQAKSKLKRCIEDGIVVYSKHFRDELANDDLTMQDVLSVCSSGAIIKVPEQDIKTGSWKYPAAQFLYMNLLAYLAAWVIYQGGQYVYRLHCRPRCLSPHEAVYR